MTHFSELTVKGQAAGSTYISGGAGRPVVVLQAPAQSGPQPYHELLAEGYQVILLVADESLSQADELENRLNTMDVAHCALVCETQTAAIGLRYVQQSPGMIGQLVLKAPHFEPDLATDLTEVQTPVLVLESSHVEEAGLGQQLAVSLPNCYHILVYDGAESLNDRPEAVAEVIGDFLERSGKFVVGKSHGVIHP